MDQPFESDVIDDLASDTPISSADEFDSYEGINEEGFEEDGFADGMDEFSGDDAASLEDNLEGDLWDDYTDSSDAFREHDSNQRESNRQTHEDGKRRRTMDRGGEKGDRRGRAPSSSGRRCCGRLGCDGSDDRRCPRSRRQRGCRKHLTLN